MQMERVDNWGHFVFSLLAFLHFSTFHFYILRLEAFFVENANLSESVVKKVG